jgi:nicotinate-nucleotide pyrophosphorylase (carboxylating)
MTIAGAGRSRTAPLFARQCAQPALGPRLLEVEVDTLAQLEEAPGVRVDAVLLDNMSVDKLRKGVAMIDGRTTSEASGRVNLETAPAIAETWADFISAGWLTHSAPILDIGLDYDQR